MSYLSSKIVCQRFALSTQIPLYSALCLRISLEKHSCTNNRNTDRSTSNRQSHHSKSKSHHDGNAVRRIIKLYRDVFFLMLWSCLQAFLLKINEWANAIFKCFAWKGHFALKINLLGEFKVSSLRLVAIQVNFQFHNLLKWNIPMNKRKRW